VPIEAVIYLKRYDLKSIKQVLRRPMTLLVTLYCLTTGLTYDRARFTYKSRRNPVQKYYVFSSHHCMDGWMYGEVFISFLFVVVVIVASDMQNRFLNFDSVFQKKLGFGSE